MQLRISGRTWLAASALVDSGASVSLFDGSIGRALGLVIRKGKRIRPAGISGVISAYVHRVALKVMRNSRETLRSLTNETCQ